MIPDRLSENPHTDVIPACPESVHSFPRSCVGMHTNQPIPDKPE